MNTRTAVVIEDDPDISHLIKTVLERSGFTVHTADNGPAGVRAAKEHNPSLITSDMHLPGFDGLEVIRRVRQFSTVPLMIISASNALHDVEIALIAGADHYLPKPFRPNILQAHAQALLRRPL